MADLRAISALARAQAKPGRRRGHKTNAVMRIKPLGCMTMESGAVPTRTALKFYQTKPISTHANNAQEGGALGSPTH